MVLAAIDNEGPILFEGVPPLFPEEPLPGGWAQIETIEKFVRWAGRLGRGGASDIKMNSSTPVSVRVDGQYYPVTVNKPTPLELSLMLDAVTQDRSSSSVAKGGTPVDFSFEVLKAHHDRRSGKWRLRGNATGVVSMRVNGRTLNVGERIFRLTGVGGFKLPGQWKPDIEAPVSVSGIAGSSGAKVGTD